MWSMKFRLRSMLPSISPVSASVPVMRWYRPEETALSVGLKGAHHRPEGTAPYLQFRGNVDRKVVEVTDWTGPAQSFELADLDLPKVKSLLSDWLAKLP